MSSNFYYIEEGVDDDEIKDCIDFLEDCRKNEDGPKKKEQKEDQKEAQKEIDQPANNQELIENERKVSLKKFFKCVNSPLFCKFKKIKFRYLNTKKEYKKWIDG